MLLLLNQDGPPQFWPSTVGRQTVLSQYANSPIILGLVDSIDAFISCDQDLENFYKFAWNISTAKGVFLDIWGRIVNVSRVITVPASDYTGFSEGNYPGFGQAKFYSDQVASTNYPLSDDAFRLMILAKALSNISRATFAVYNKILMQLFEGRGRCYVGTSGDMKARLTFEFLLKDFEIAILKQSNVFEPPTGVQFDIMAYPPLTTIGFSEAGRVATFGHGALFRDFI